MFRKSSGISWPFSGLWRFAADQATSRQPGAANKSHRAIDAQGHAGRMPSPCVRAARQSRWPCASGGQVHSAVIAFEPVSSRGEPCMSAPFCPQGCDRCHQHGMHDSWRRSFSGASTSFLSVGAARASRPQGPRPLGQGARSKASPISTAQNATACAAPGTPPSTPPPCLSNVTPGELPPRRKVQTSHSSRTHRCDALSERLRARDMLISRPTSWHVRSSSFGKKSFRHTNARRCMAGAFDKGAHAPP